MIAKEMQSKWEDNQLIGLDVIINDVGVVREIDIEFEMNYKFKDTFNKEYKISLGNETTLDALIEQYDEVWSEIQVSNKVQLPDGDFLLCGEGEMGNEGFIARTDGINRLKWFMYSTTSNPFVNVIEASKCVYFQSTLGFYLCFDITNNNISIKNEKSW
ncbi:hypothetical protein DMW62_00115 [Serratia marcescens]|uniref:Uncharacterized protein n=1 Tax=Serratia marcescens TaxID=615 RepID=A0ABX5NNI0_SERMA|nr:MULTISPECIES: hypothetical protein [Serratia]MDI9106149.1 hypothetical protein [Serratia marcescens]MDR8493063.1 hypothetical protein [Serratia nevei]MDR8537227.1 hypothetical protein [Serratia nevei]PXZ97648.1 hypothetical protein CW300_04240 [Serratia marcescens]PYA13212.1 hypothetical protein DMW42_18725 [Serratia marcescens]